MTKILLHPSSLVMDRIYFIYGANVNTVLKAARLIVFCMDILAIFFPTLQSSSKLNGELPDPTVFLGSIPGCHISELTILTIQASDHSF
jgi:hypothetical protein